MDTPEITELRRELKRLWRMMWRDRFDDRVRAEGVTTRDYPKLDVERGRVIVATRDYKPLDFLEVFQRYIEQYKPGVWIGDAVPPSPSVGGWGKFVRDVLSRQSRFTRRGREASPKPGRGTKQQQRKKGGRGWLHH